MIAQYNASQLLTMREVRAYCTIPSHLCLSFLVSSTCPCGRETEVRGLGKLMHACLYARYPLVQKQM